LALLL